MRKLNRTLLAAMLVGASLVANSSGAVAEANKPWWKPLVASPKAAQASVFPLPKPKPKKPQPQR